MEKEYDINIKENKETNDFLRCLWSRLRVHFGKAAWQIIPMRFGDTAFINIGNVDLGNVSKNYTPTSIHCTYSKRGCLKTLVWTNSSLLHPEEFEQKFDVCVNEAKDYKEYFKEYFLQVKFDNQISFSHSRGENFNVAGNILTFKQIAFDKEDYSTFSQNATKIIASLLTFDTLEYINYSNSGIAELRKTAARTIRVENFDDKEEGFEINTSAHLKDLKLSSYIVNYIDSFLDKDLDYDEPYNLFEKSIMSFSQAILFEELAKSQFRFDFSPQEHAATSYMSALEIITLLDIEPSRCNECGLEKYSIAKRVVGLVEAATNDNQYVKKLISKFYGVRSKFVHAGEYLSSSNYTGTSFPLLSKKESDGVINQLFYFDSSFKEIIRKCILWHESQSQKNDF